MYFTNRTRVRRNNRTDTGSATSCRWALLPATFPLPLCPVTLDTFNKKNYELWEMLSQFRLNIALTGIECEQIIKNNSNKILLYEIHRARD